MISIIIFSCKLGVQVSWIITQHKLKNFISSFSSKTCHSLVNMTTLGLSTGGTNIYDIVGHIDTTNLSSAFVECTFQPNYTCTIDYGTDPSYTNLVYRDTSSTQGRVTTINLFQKLREDTTYYYIVSARSSSQCVKVRGRFRTGRY